MAEEFALFNKLAPHIAALPDRTPLTKEDLLVPTFQLYSENGLGIYYIPFDYVNPRAKVVVVGITPGFTQMEIAYRVARQSLLDGLSPLEACKRVDSYASFAGTMRMNLVAMLDGIGLPEELDIERSASLFGSHSELLHSTSAVRYPIFVNDENYAGHTPRLLDSPALKEYVDGLLLEELQSTKDALVIPLGQSVSSVLKYLIESKLLDSTRCLLDFPHPSGANGHHQRHYKQRQPEFVEKVQQWFGKRLVVANQLGRAQDAR